MTRFLDEQISFTINIGGTLASRPAAGTYTYMLKMFDVTIYEEETTIFVGNFYYNRQTSVTLNLTDIIRNNVPTFKSTFNYMMSGSDVIIANNIYRKYWVEVNFGGTTGTKTSSSELVACVYRYPKLSEYNSTLNGYAQFVDYTGTGTIISQSIRYLLLGFKTNSYDTNSQDLIPRYPLKYTTNCSIALTVGFGVSVQDINWEIRSPEYTENFITLTIQDTYYDLTAVFSIGSLLNGYYHDIDNPAYDVYMYMYDFSGTHLYVVAKFDLCYERYYLIWKDRFGSFQSQPFKDNATYSESFEPDEFTTYDNKRQLSSVTVKPKWSIQSGWLAPKNYIYYESIYTSPFLLLYDTVTDKCHSVLVSGSYTEKNYKNQKDLINIKLELEASENQNINY